jgi:Integrase core domain
MQRFGRKLRFKACHWRESAPETGVIREMLPCGLKVKWAGWFEHLTSSCAFMAGHQLA